MAGKPKGKISNVVVWIILVLLIIGLAGFGVTGFGGSVRNIGKVGDTPIDVNRYARDLQNEIARLSQQLGQNVSLNQAQQFGIDRAVLQRIVSTVALENEAADLGLSAGDAEVRDQVVSIPAFQGIDGKFDREAYRFALERSGMSESRFEDSLRAEIARSLIQGAVSAGTVAPPAYTDAILNFVAERRDFHFATVGVDMLDAPLPDPTEADLQAYYETNEADFMLPETRRITYAWLSPEMVVDQIDVDEAALEQLYQDRIADYVTPERRLVERLIFADADAAAAARAALDAGETTFEDLVADRDLTLADVDMGDVTQAALGQAGEAVFALNEPGIAGPVETDLGPAIFRMNAILPAQETTFAEAREGLLDEYALERARRDVGNRIEEIDDLLAGGATLEDLAAETEMTLGTLDWTANSSDGIAAFPAFRQAASTTETGDFPEVIELDDGGIFALRVEEVIEPRPEPFDDARERVEEGWIADETAKALAAKAEDLAAKISAGTDPATLDLTMMKETDITRESFIPDVPSDFVETVFSMEKDAVQVVPGETAAYIVRLDAISPPDLDDPDLAKRAEAFAETTAQGLGADLLAAYSAAVEAEAGIELNQAAINAVHANFQ